MPEDLFYWIQHRSPVCSLLIQLCMVWTTKEEQTRKDSELYRKTNIGAHLPMIQDL